MKLRAVIAAVALVFALAGGATAGTLPGGPPDFRLDITGAGEALHLTPTLTPNANGTYSASGSGEVAGAFSVTFDFVLNPDPAVNGSFTLTSLSSSTQTFSVSATLGVLPIAGPTRVGGSYGETTYTDTSRDGILGLGADPFYSALIDDASVQNLGSFAFNPVASDPGLIGTLSQEVFGAPVPSAAGPGVSGSIGVSFPGFMLSGGDQVQVPFEFVVVPEPAFVTLFACSLALLFLGLARERASLAARRTGRI